MRNLLIIVVFVCLAISVSGQKTDLQEHLFRLSLENDGINAWLKGTDWGYTNGLRMDYMYSAPAKKKASARIITRPSLLTSGWGIQQIMITPKKTRPAIPDKNDYPYAGGLIVTHTRYRTDLTRYRNVQTEWVAGLMGPPSLAKQSQTLLHRIIGDPEPNGWDYQLPNDLLLNFNYSLEQQLTGNKNASIIAGGTASAGTMTNGLSLYSLLMFRKNLAYFMGPIRQLLASHPEKPGYAIQAKPVLSYTLYQALLDGGLLNKASPVRSNNARSGTLLKRNKIQARLDLQLLFAFKKWSISFTQKFFSPDFRGYESHRVGNITLAAGW